VNDPLLFFFTEVRFMEEQGITGSVTNKGMTKRKEKEEGG